MGSPSLIDAQASKVLAIVSSVAAFLHSFVLGCIVSDGGSAQASGANGALTLDIDTTRIVDAAVSGKGHELAAQTAVLPSTASVLWGATSGKAVIATVVLKTGANNDTPAIDAVFGAVAATGAQVAPTEAEITAALGHSNWAKIAEVTVTRTGDTAITVAVSHKAKWGREISFGALAESETEFRTGV